MVLWCEMKIPIHAHTFPFPFPFPYSTLPLSTVCALLNSTVLFSLKSYFYLGAQPLYHSHPSLTHRTPKQCRISLYYCPAKPANPPEPNPADRLRKVPEQEPEYTLLYTIYYIVRCCQRTLGAHYFSSPDTAHCPSPEEEPLVVASSSFHI